METYFEMTQKKKPYSPPALTGLTREHAIKLVAERKNCSEEEAADFLQSFLKRTQSTSKDQEGKRPAQKPTARGLVPQMWK
jgi:hypothetical protein